MVFHRLHFLVACQLAVARVLRPFIRPLVSATPSAVIFLIFFLSIFVIPFPSGVLAYIAHLLGFSYFSCSCCCFYCGAACSPALCIRLTCRFAQIESLTCDGDGVGFGALIHAISRYVVLGINWCSYFLKKKNPSFFFFFFTSSSSCGVSLWRVPTGTKGLDDGPRATACQRESRRWTDEKGNGRRGRSSTPHFSWGPELSKRSRVGSNGEALLLVMGFREVALSTVGAVQRSFVGPRIHQDRPGHTDRMPHEVLPAYS